MTFRRVLVAIDFAEPAEHALAVATELARTHGGELILLHVYSELPAYPDVAVAQLAAVYEEQRRWVEDALEQRARRARAAGLLARPVVRTGSPAIAEAAADLLVIGPHGRSGLDRLIVGSVAERVVRLAPCPVLVAKTKRAAARSAAA